MAEFEKAREDSKLLGNLEVVSWNDVNSQELTSRLNQVYEDAIDELGLGQEVELRSVYVCGSYARGEAVLAASDLDIRFVVRNVQIDKELLDEFRSSVRNIWIQEYSRESDLFKIIDAWIETEKPQSESIKIL